MLLLLLWPLLLMSCLETANVVELDRSSSANLTNSSSSISLLNADNKEFTLSKERENPTILYANEAAGVRLQLNLKGARGLNLVDIHKLEPESPPLRREVARSGFSHFFELAGNRENQIYSVTRQGGDEFYIKITAQPSMVIESLNSKEKVEYALSFENSNIIFSFEGSESLNMIQITPYNHQRSSLLFEYPDEREIDLQKMLGEISEKTLVNEDNANTDTDKIYQLRINMATDILGHRIFNPKPYFMRAVKQGVPLLYRVFSNSQVTSKDIKICPTGTGRSLLGENKKSCVPPQPSSRKLRTLDLGAPNQVFIRGATEGGTTLKEPVSLKQSFGKLVDFTGSLFQNDGGVWTSVVEDLANDVQDSWFVTNLNYKNDDIFAEDSFIEVITESATKEFVYRTETLFYRFPCAQIVAKQTGDYNSIDGSFADLRDNRERSSFENYPSTLGATLENKETPEEPKTCTDYESSNYDNYYILPSASESENNDWKNLQMALAWKPDWNYADFDYSFSVERKNEDAADAAWVDISLENPPSSQRYIPFDLLTDTLEGDDKKAILLYRLKPTFEHPQIKAVNYERPIPYYFIRYPQLYPELKKLYSDSSLDPYPENFLFVDLSADFSGQGGTTASTQYFRVEDRTSIQQTPVDNTFHYHIIKDNNTLEFFLPTDDTFSFTGTDYRERATRDRRKVKRWFIKSENENISLKRPSGSDATPTITVEEEFDDYDRTLKIEVSGFSGQACGRITAAITMIDGDSTSSEFFLCFGS